MQISPSRLLDRLYSFFRKDQNNGLEPIWIEGQNYICLPLRYVQVQREISLQKDYGIIHMTVYNFHFPVMNNSAVRSVGAFNYFFSDSTADQYVESVRILNKN